MRVLLLNQCFYPDVVSTAQHLTDLATGLAERGHRVTVLTSNRGYDEPDLRFPMRERWKGIEIIRLRSFSFGKQSRWRRALNFGSYAAACTLRLTLLQGFDVVVALTSPPLISFIAALFVRIKGGRLYFWVMDLNPDEAIAAGWLKSNSLTARTLKRMLRYSLTHASQTIALDRFMKERIKANGIDGQRVTVLPPWTHDDAVNHSETGRKSFRNEYGLTDKFVVMYSGNHSPCHPLDTLLGAALHLRNDKRFKFCFIGGGSEQKKVRDFALDNGLDNILCLPYQSLNALAGSLSAADLHVVVMGNDFTGIVHPCKIYNVLRIGAPVLYIGPEESHITDLAARNSQQFSLCRHGDVQSVVEGVLAATLVGRNHSSVIAEPFSRDRLLPRLMEVIETNDVSVTLTEAVTNG